MSRLLPLLPLLLLADLPAPAPGQGVPVQLSFADLLAPGPALRPSPGLAALAGRRVQLSGFMADLEEPPRGAFYLTARPCSLRRGRRRHGRSAARGGAGRGPLRRRGGDPLLPGGPRGLRRPLPGAPGPTRRAALPSSASRSIGPRTWAAPPPPSLPLRPLPTPAALTHQTKEDHEPSARFPTPASPRPPRRDARPPALALPASVTVTPPDGARFLEYQRFDIRVEGKGTGPFGATLAIDGAPSPSPPARRTPSTPTASARAGWGGFNVRGFASTARPPHPHAPRSPTRRARSRSTSTVRVSGWPGSRGAAARSRTSSSSWATAWASRTGRRPASSSTA